MLEQNEGRWKGELNGKTGIFPAEVQCDFLAYCTHAYLDLTSNSHPYFVGNYLFYLDVVCKVDRGRRGFGNGRG